MIKEICHRKHNYELLLLFQMGMRGVDMIKLGYPPSSVWRYSKYYETALKKVRELLQKSTEIKAQEDSKKLKIKPDDKRLKNPFMKEIQFEEKKV